MKIGVPNDRRRNRLGDPWSTVPRFVGDLRAAEFHWFHAMRGLHHREPGAAGAALLIRGLTVSVIADRVHVHPAVLRLIARTAGTGRIALVTDAVSAAGMERGLYTLGAETIDVRDGASRLPDETLAGSVLRLDRAVRNFAADAEVSIREVVQAATLVSARLLGLARKGPDRGRL